MHSEQSLETPESNLGFTITDDRHPDLRLVLFQFVEHGEFGVPTYFFKIIDVANGTIAGLMDLRGGSNELIEQYAGHVGCRVYPEHRGRRISSRVIAVVAALAVKLGVDPMWLTCDPDNIASAICCERAGGVLVETVAVPADVAVQNKGFKNRYRVDARALALQTALSLQRDEQPLAGLQRDGAFDL